MVPSNSFILTKYEATTLVITIYHFNHPCLAPKSTIKITLIILNNISLNFLWYVLGNIGFKSLLLSALLILVYQGMLLFLHLKSRVCRIFECISKIGFVGFVNASQI